MPVTSITLARNLGMLSALPAALNQLPYPELEPILQENVRNLFRDGNLPPRAHLEWLSRFHRMLGGRYRAFRTTEPPGLPAPGVR